MESGEIFDETYIVQHNHGPFVRPLSGATTGSIETGNRLLVESTSQSPVVLTPGRQNIDTTTKTTTATSTATTLAPETTTTTKTTSDYTPRGIKQTELPETENNFSTSKEVDFVGESNEEVEDFTAHESSNSEPPTDSDDPRSGPHLQSTTSRITKTKIIKYRKNNTINIHIRYKKGGGMTVPVIVFIILGGLAGVTALLTWCRYKSTFAHRWKQHDRASPYEQLRRDDSEVEYYGSNFTSVSSLPSLPGNTRV